MNNYYEVIAVSSFSDVLKEVEKEQGVRVNAIEMSRKITPLKDLLALIKLYIFLKREKPLIVHTHTPKAGTVGMLAAKMARVPFRLHTVGGLPLLETKGAKRKLLDLVEKLTYACASRVYPNSFKLSEIIIRNNYAKASKLKVIAGGSSNGIKTSHFSIDEVSDDKLNELRNKLGISKTGTTFCFIGRIVKDKGINELVVAFRNVYEIDSSARLLLVGYFENELDPVSPDTEKIIYNHPAIHFLGYQADVRPFLAISDVFVFPSYREGFPNAVMQAGAMNIPSIVTDINGCNEIIKDGVNGIIVPPKDIEALQNAMLEMIYNTEKRHSMALVSRAMIVERYEQSYVWSELLNEYKSFETEVKV